MQLRLDAALVERARGLAGGIVDPVVTFITAHGTVAVERAVARLLGVEGVDADGVPLANRVVDALPARETGVARALGAALSRDGRTPEELARDVAAGAPLGDGRDVADRTILRALRPHVEGALARIDDARRARDAYARRLPPGPAPMLYVIVASGDIYEDRTAAVAAAEAGAQIVAVIRSTAQSLLDYVPEGATREGFGGTYATRENFRIMRAALDAASERLGRYVMLTNYASGLCMPEIAALAAFERVDMLLNDAMYGILFRDINMRRTFVDQHFSRLLCARAGITINTGEDNYLTTADAVEQAPAVLASQLVNEAFAHRAGLPDTLIGLGDAYEIDPTLPDAFLLQLAQAQLARQIFPNAPLKYMPPTKHVTGDIFKTHLIDAMFNLASVMTRQTIHLCGMPTEAIHTPLLADRALSLDAARYVMTTARTLGDELEIKPGGAIERRAHGVLRDAVTLLEDVERCGLMDAIASGTFADVRRAPDGGRGHDGVFRKDAAYLNPFEAALASDAVPA